MDWKAHAAIGIIASLAIFYFFLGIASPVQLLLLAALSAAAALIPDVDNNESKGREVLDLAIIATASFLSYSSFCGGSLCIPGVEQLGRIAVVALALLGMYFIFLRFVMPRHRGIVHSLAVCLGFTALLYLFTGKDYALAGFIGFFSHLAADDELKLA
jgi:membrane-bound metal-dependent hydrolase YbcI (DUF457 family)